MAMTIAFLFLDCAVFVLYIHFLLSPLSSCAEIPSLRNSYKGKSGTFGFTADTQFLRCVIKEG